MWRVSCWTNCVSIINVCLPHSLVSAVFENSNIKSHCFCRGSSCDANFLIWLQKQVITATLYTAYGLYLTFWSLRRAPPQGWCCSCWWNRNQPSGVPPHDGLASHHYRNIKKQNLKVQNNTYFNHYLPKPLWSINSSILLFCPLTPNIASFDLNCSEKLKIITI